MFNQIVFKWVTLHTPLPWPYGVPTRLEIVQGHGGTPPWDWMRDRTELQELIPVAARQSYGFHPLFGEMDKADWVI